MNIKFKDLKIGMIILDKAGEKMQVREIWADQGPGNGIMVKGVLTERQLPVDPPKNIQSEIRFLDPKRAEIEVFNA